MQAGLLRARKDGASLSISQRSLPPTHSLLKSRCPIPGSQHEKIIRGLAVGLALVQYGREEGAETLIEQMSRDQVRCRASVASAQPRLAQPGGEPR